MSKTPEYLQEAMSVVRGDQRMAPLVEQHGPPRLKSSDNIFEYLVRSVVSQQLSTKAADTILRRVLGCFGECDFPQPHEFLQVEVERLREAGLSGQKVGYVLDLAGKFDSGEIDGGAICRMEDEEIKAALTRVKGIGPWTVDMVLIFALNRPDVLPTGDLGIKNGFRKVYELERHPTVAEMSEIAEAWRPYRTVGSWYLWAALD